MRKQVLVMVLAAFATICVSLAHAQQKAKIRRIGWLSFNYTPSAREDAFLKGLRDLGYIEGRNIVIEHRSAGGKEERLARLAAELAGMKVDVIAALEPPAAQAAQKAAGTIPVVIRSSGDPVAEGYVASIAHPGGNTTGVYSIAEELVGKRLELLKEVVPAISRVAVLWSPETFGSERWMKEAETTARSISVRLQSLEARDIGGIKAAFQAAKKGLAGGMITLRNPTIVVQRKLIADLAQQSRLPAIYDDREFVEAAGLMSYGANLEDLYRRAATYVDKILKGARPADLPVEQPTKFELVINLKAAKQIGLTIPQSVLYRADKVIK